MAFTTARTWTTGEVVTASTMNTDHRDNISFLYNAPSARAFNNAPISVANSTNTVLTLNSERWDNDDIHSTTTNTSRLTCQTAGVYAVVASVVFAANSTGTRSLFLALNGSTSDRLGQVEFAPSAGVCAIVVHTQYKLTVGDYVEAYVFQNSGGALNVNSDSKQSPEFGMTWISAG